MTAKLKAPPVPEEPKKTQFAVSVLVDETDISKGVYHLELAIHSAASEMEARGMAMTGALIRHPSGRIRNCLALKVP